MSFLTVTANAMTMFLEEYLNANKKSQISPKEFAFLKVRGNASTGSAESAESEESDAEGKGKAIILLNSCKTPKPHHGVICPDHAFPKLCALLEKNALASRKKIARKWDGMVFLVGDLEKVRKVLSKDFEIEEEESADFVRPPWIKAKVAAPKGKKGRPSKKKEEIEEEPPKKKSSKKVEEEETLEETLEDSEEEPPKKKSNKKKVEFEESESE